LNRNYVISINSELKLFALDSNQLSSLNSGCICQNSLAARRYNALIPLGGSRRPAAPPVSEQSDYRAVRLAPSRPGSTRTSLDNRHRCPSSLRQAWPNELGLIAFQSIGCEVVRRRPDLCRTAAARRQCLRASASHGRLFQYCEWASCAQLRSSAASSTGLNILLRQKSQVTLMTLRSSNAYLTAAEIAVIFQPLMAGSDPPLVRRCFPEAGAAGGRMFAGQKR
jgi:hypothetical protein